MDEEVTRTRAATVLRREGASFAFVFGSRAPGGQPRLGSDLDVAAYWTVSPPNAWDVLVPEGVDLLVLNTAPLELAGAIALNGDLLFETDPAACVRWVATTRKIWLDEKPRFELAHREFLEALRGR